MGITKNRVNLFTAVLLLGFNSFMLIVNDSASIDRYVNVLIPIIGLVFLFLFKKKNLYIFYTIVGILITIFGTPGNFSGSVMFFISMYDKKTRMNITLNSLSIIVSLYIKIHLMNYFPTHIFSLVLSFLFILSHMYLRFWKSENLIKTTAHTKGLSVEQMDTVKILIQGLSKEESAKKLNIERSTLSKRISGLKTRYNVNNEFQLAFALLEDGVISVNDFTFMKIQDNNVTKNL